MNNFFFCIFRTAWTIVNYLLKLILEFTNLQKSTWRLYLYISVLHLSYGIHGVCHKINVDNKKQFDHLELFLDVLKMKCSTCLFLTSWLSGFFVWKKPRWKVWVIYRFFNEAFFLWYFLRDAELYGWMTALWTSWTLRTLRSFCLLSWRPSIDQTKQGRIPAELVFALWAQQRLLFPLLHFSLQ